MLDFAQVLSESTELTPPPSPLPPSSEKRAYRRRYKRQHIKVKALVELYLQNGFLFDDGSCTIQDLCPEGALVTHISFKNEAFPLVPFFLKFRIAEGEFEGLTAQGDPVRFVNHQGKLGIGVRFTEFACDVLE